MGAIANSTSAALLLGPALWYLSTRAPDGCRTNTDHFLVGPWPLCQLEGRKLEGSLAEAAVPDGRVLSSAENGSNTKVAQPYSPDCDG